MRKPLVLLVVFAAVGGAWLIYRSVFASYDIANSPPRAGPIIALGDSLTYGHGAPRGQSYPDQLAALIGRPVVNRGVSGETAAQALGRLERDVLSESPAITIVCLGGNDLLQMNDVDGTFEALEKIVTRTVESGSMVVLVGVEGLPLISEDFGERFEALAKKTGSVYVPDVLDGIFGRAKLTADKIHPNAAGYAIMAERIAMALKPHLN